MPDRLSEAEFQSRALLKHHPTTRNALEGPQRGAGQAGQGRVAARCSALPRTDARRWRGPPQPRRRALRSRSVGRGAREPAAGPGAAARGRADARRCRQHDAPTRIDRPKRSSVPERALATQSREAEAQNNLGNAYLELQQYAEAERSYRQALKAQARRCTDPVQSRICAERPAADARRPWPASARPWHRTPSSSMRSMDWAMCCVTWATDARPPPCSAGPSNIDPRARRIATATWERSCSRSVASMRQWQAFGEALRLNPDYAPAHLGLALAFRQQRRPEDAEASCAAALAADPGNVEAVCAAGRAAGRPWPICGGGTLSFSERLSSSRTTPPPTPVWPRIAA